MAAEQGRGVILPLRFRAARRWFEATLRRTGLPEESIADYRALFDQPGAETAAINWYRAAVLTPPTRFTPVSVASLFVYASGDMAMSRQAADLTGRYVTGRFQYEVLDGVGHWIPEVAPDAVVEMLRSHLGAP